jgi:EmrB/QacA subfamily drug resistance transporter
VQSTRSVMAPLAAIILGTFMVILDNTVVTVALAQLGKFFATDITLLQWVITGYFLAQAAVIPLAGWLSDRFGAKRIYLTSVVLFTLGSALCGLATSAPMLVATRVLQGLGGGMLMPIGMAVVYRLTPPERRGAIMGLFGLPLMVAPALGPVLGGYLVEFASWRYIFLLNVPVGTAALLVGLRVLPNLPAARSAGALDGPGMLLGPVAFASLSFGISESTTAGWTGTPTVAGVAVGLAALALFVWRELSVEEPLLELRVFGGRDFRLAIATQWAGWGAMFGSFFLMPLFLQQVRGYGSFETGLITVPNAVASAVFMQIGGRLFDRVGARIPVIAGFTLVAAAMALMTRLSGTTTTGDMVAPLTLMGAGMGLMMMSLNTHMLNSAPRELTSRVTSLSQALQNVVSSLAVATFSTVLAARMPLRLAEAAAAAGGQPPPAAVAVASARAFGDVYVVVLAIIGVAWALGWTLRRHPATTAPAPAPAASGEAASARAEEPPERELVAAGHF